MELFSARRCGVWFVSLALAAFTCLAAHAQTPGIAPTISKQPSSIVSPKIGSSYGLSVTASGSQPLEYQWRKDGILLSGLTNSSLVLYNIQVSRSGQYDVIVKNSYGAITSSVANVFVQGFNSLQVSNVYGVTGFVPLPNGKTLLPGSFSLYYGGTNLPLRLLYSDSELDLSFVSPLASNNSTNFSVTTAAAQRDGGVILGGSFVIPATGQKYLCRLTPDGLCDAKFHPDVNDAVYSCLIQTDGRILIAGAFTSAGGRPQEGIARLNPDGSLDSSFQASAQGGAACLTVQDDGKILVGGRFTNICGQSFAKLARLNPDGTLDSSFSPEITNSAVNVVVVQRDGRILAGFSNPLGSPVNMARYESDGKLQQPFRDPWSPVNSIVCQANQSMFACSDTALSRFLSDGTFDDSFVYSCVTGSAIALLADGSTIVDCAVRYGWSLQNQYRSGLTGLSKTHPSIQHLSYDGTNISWELGGTFPEPYMTVFEYTTNGTCWTSLGAGRHSEAGWFLANAPVPSNATIRAVGSVASGTRNAYTFPVEGYGGMPLITKQPVSQTNTSGNAIKFTVEAKGASPLNYQWFKDGIPLNDSIALHTAGAQTSSLVLSKTYQTNVGTYYVVASNSSGVVTSDIVRLSLCASVTADEFSPIANSSASLSVMAIQTDGKILLGGQNLSSESPATLSRYTSYGTIDSSFNVWSNISISSMAIQTDGKIIIGNSNPSGTSSTHLWRLNQDGTLDGSFSPTLEGSVAAISVQADGKILVGGTFSKINGLVSTTKNLVRFNTDGSLDLSFRASVDGMVSCQTIQNDGKIWIGGSFSNLFEKQWTSPVVRLNPDGTFDTNSPAISITNSFETYVNCIAIQADGRVLVGGRFTDIRTSLGSIVRTNLVRFLANGMVDQSFNLAADSAANSLCCIAAQENGKILIGASAEYALSEYQKSSLIRVDVNGNIDAAFFPWVLGSVNQLGIQADGRILAGGTFTSTGTTQRHISRFSNCVDSAMDQLIVDEQKVKWIRSGSAPQVRSATFEYSHDGVTWSWLGIGSHTTEGWELDVSIPPDSTIRATGRVTAGSQSSWLIEAKAGLPFLLWQTPLATGSFGGTAFFVATAQGSGPLSYFWLKNGIPLNRPSSSTGSSSTLVISNMSGFDIGSYSVIISNTFGCITSPPSLLSVVDPLIVYQSEHYDAGAGSDLDMRMNIVGSYPISLYWTKDGSLINTSDSWTNSYADLRVTNLLGGDSGNYTLIVSNSFGCVTSKVVTVSVSDPVIALPPHNATVHPGESANLQVVAYGTDLKYQWRKNGIPIPNAISTNLSLPATTCRPSDAYDVVIESRFGCVTSWVAQVSLDKTTVDPMNPSIDGRVLAIALQTDSRILIGGSFTNVNEQIRNGLARFSSDGILDVNFNPNVSGTVNCIAVQEDGKIVVGGTFSRVGEQLHANLVRLKSDGTRDSEFLAETDGTVRCVTTLKDGKILIGGQFSMVGGMPTWYLARLNPDGSFDSTFTSSAASPINTFAIQPSGKILAGGNGVTRFNADGSLDNTFSRINGTVFSLVDSRQGIFVVSGGVIWGFKSNGDPDPGICTMSGNAEALGLESNGKLVASGYYFLRAFGPDGRQDPTFIPSLCGEAKCLAIQEDGKVLAGGTFTALSDVSRAGFCRLNNEDVASQELVCDGSTVTWIRRGSSPCPWTVGFEICTNGSTWTSLGQGLQTDTGWQLTGISVPTNALIRARGCISGGGVSSWYVESTATYLGVSAVPPTILPGTSVSTDQTNCFGLRISGHPGQTVFVEKSSNLFDWTAIWTNVVGSETFEFIDPTQQETSAFYRLRLKPVR